MTYLRSLFFNFLAVFFVNRVMPGIMVHDFEGVPSIGADLFFSLIVGFLNASIFPFFVILDLNITKLKIALFSFFISYIPFAAIGIFPFGVQVENFMGFIYGGTLVWLASYFSNYLEWQHNLLKK